MNKAFEIKEFPGYYATENGNIYSRKQGRIKKLKLEINKWGYCRVHLWKNKKIAHKSIHRLIAEAFIPNTENKCDINHKNGIKTDNRVENLEWATRSENIYHAFNVLHRKTNKPWLNKFGKNHNRAKSILQIKKDKIVSEFGSILEAQRKTGIDHSSISMCCTGKRHTAGGYKWIYKD